MAQLPPVRVSSGRPTMRLAHSRASRPVSLTSVPSLTSRTSSGGSQADDDSRHATIPSKYEPLPAIPRRLVRQNTYDLIEPLMLKLTPEPGTAQVGPGEPTQGPDRENASVAGAAPPTTFEPNKNRQKNCDWTDDCPESVGGGASVGRERTEKVRTMNSLFIDAVLPDGATEPSQRVLSEYTGTVHNAHASSDDVASYSETIRKKKGIVSSASESSTDSASPTEATQRCSSEDFEENTSEIGGDQGDDSTVGVNDNDDANGEATDNSGSSHTDDSVDGEQEDESHERDIPTDSLEVGAGLCEDKRAFDQREGVENNTLRLNNYCVHQEEPAVERQCGS